MTIKLYRSSPVIFNDNRHVYKHLFLAKDLSSVMFWGQLLAQDYYMNAGVDLNVPLSELYFWIEEIYLPDNTPAMYSFDTIIENAPINNWVRLIDIPFDKLRQQSQIWVKPDEKYKSKIIGIANSYQIVFKDDTALQNNIMVFVDSFIDVVHKFENSVLNSGDPYQYFAKKIKHGMEYVKGRYHNIIQLLEIYSVINHHDLSIVINDAVFANSRLDHVIKNTGMSPYLQDFYNNVRYHVITLQQIERNMIKIQDMFQSILRDINSDDDYRYKYVAYAQYSPIIQSIYKDLVLTFSDIKKSTNLFKKNFRI